MAIPVELVKPTILAFLQQLKDAQCDARGLGIDTEVGEELDIEVTIIAPAGLNYIPRTTIQTTGTKEDQVINPEITIVSTDDPVTSTSEAGLATSQSIQTKTDPEQRTTRTSQPKVTETTRSAAPSVSETRDSQSSSQTSYRLSSGGNEMNESYTYVA